MISQHVIITNITGASKPNSILYEIDCKYCFKYSYI